MALNMFYDSLSAASIKISSGGTRDSGKRVALQHTLPQTDREKWDKFNNSAFVVCFLTCLSLGFVGIFGLVSIVFEAETEIKTHQFINSVDITAYWIANLVYDYVMFLPPILSILFVVYICDVTAWTHWEIFPAIVYLLLMFWGGMPAFGYVFGQVFKSSQSALRSSLFMNTIAPIPM